MTAIERFFHVEKAGSTVRRELLAGVSTYVAMCYIILVNPPVLAQTGMDAGAVMAATCVASAVATLWMAFHANYPIALAPGMGHNFFFAITICGPVAAGGLGYSWRAALAATLLSGILFMITWVWGMRARIITLVPDHLKTAIGVGIGLMIAMVGLRWGGVLVSTPGLYIGLGSLKGPAPLLTLFGLAVMGVLSVMRVRAALVLGVLATAIAAAAVGVTHFTGILGAPPSLAPTFLRLDFKELFRHGDFITVVFVLLVVDVFDTVGTLIAVGARGGFLVQGKLPRAQQALFSDAVGTVTASIFGTSTVTSYVESAAGVSAGGRTGLSSVVTAGLLLSSLFFYPLVRMVGGGVDAGGGIILYPILAPALILVGCLMMHGVGDIKWEDPLQAIPAFLTVVMMPLTTNITEGIAFGFIATSLLYLVGGKGRAIDWAAHVVAALFLLRYVLLR